MADQMTFPTSHQLLILVWRKQGINFKPRMFTDKPWNGQKIKILTTSSTLRSAWHVITVHFMPLWSLYPLLVYLPFLLQSFYPSIFYFSLFNNLLVYALWPGFLYLSLWATLHHFFNLSICIVHLYQFIPYNWTLTCQWTTSTTLINDVILNIYENYFLDWQFFQ